MGYKFFMEDSPFNDFMGWINNCPVTECAIREHWFMSKYIYVILVHSFHESIGTRI